MKYLFLLCIILSTFFTSAQKIRFTDSRNQWTTYFAYHDNAPMVATFKYYTDTFAFGRYYKQLRSNTNFYYCSGVPCPGVISGGPRNFLVREDTIAGKVYYRDISTLSTDTREHMLYNYNCALGDTTSFGGLIDTVVSIDSILIGGVYHKIIRMENFTYGRNYYAVEGVGCTNGPLFPAYFGFEWNESLICFSQSGIYPPVATVPVGLGHFGTYCCFTYIADSFDNSRGCATVLSEHTTPHLASSISINPNPAINYINITTNKSFEKNTFIRLFDFTGKCLFLEEVNEQDNYIHINTSAWSTGVYLMLIQNNSGILKKEKITILQ